MNSQPTKATIRAKLERDGALFACDEVRVLIAEIEAVERQRDDANFARVHAESELLVQARVIDAARNISGLSIGAWPELKAALDEYDTEAAP